MSFSVSFMDGALGSDSGERRSVGVLSSTVLITRKTCT